MKIINMKWFASAAVLGAALLSGCDIPPQETVQRGYRGTGMEAVYSPEVLADLVAANQVPEAIPAVSSDGPKAGDIYQNVQVLGHLSVGEFTRLMAAITEWVSPEQGCNYCHVAGEGFETDTLYTKKVSRVMIAMTQNANENWGAHVGAPVLVGVLRHGNHDPRHLLGVERVRLKALACDVAVVAALLGRHPLCDGSHEAREFTDRQMTKHLYVLIDVTRLGAVRAYCGDSLRYLISSNEVCQHLGAINRLHAGAAIAPLYGLLGWYVAAT